jgi:hypothetical protein
METLFNANAINVVLGALLAVSEVLALTKVKSNSIFQLCVNVLRTLNFSGGAGKEGAEK